MNKQKKIQYLLTRHLMDCGKIRLRLPDNVTLEIGTVQDTKNGPEITDDYCFVKASRNGNAALLDTYNLGLQYPDSRNVMICMDNTMDDSGRSVKRLEVV